MYVCMYVYMLIFTSLNHQDVTLVLLVHVSLFYTCLYFSVL